MARNQSIFFLFVFFSCLCCTACKNFIGNPHPKRLPPRTVSILPPTILFEPVEWWIEAGVDTFDLKVRMDSLSTYRIKLSKQKGIKLIETKYERDSNLCSLKIKVRDTAKPGRVHFYLKKDGAQHIAAFPFFKKKEEEK